MIFSIFKHTWEQLYNYKKCLNFDSNIKCIRLNQVITYTCLAAYIILNIFELKTLLSYGHNDVSHSVKKVIIKPCIWNPT